MVKGENNELVQTVTRLDTEVKVLKENQNTMTETLEAIKEELKEKSIKDAETHGILNNVNTVVTNVQNQVSLLNETILKSIFTDKDNNNKKDRKDKYFQSSERDKEFYRKLLIICISALVTVLLSALGIQSIIQLPM